MKRRRITIDWLKVVKAIDPVLQSILFVSYFFYIDKKGSRYRFILMLLIRFQVFSSIYHLFLRFSKKRKVERILFLISAVAWMGFYHYAYLHFKEYYFVIPEGARGYQKMPLIDMTIMTLGLGIGFWYFLICMREVTHLAEQKSRKRR